MKKILSFILTLLFCCSCSCKKDSTLSVYRNFYEQDVTTFNYLTTNKYQNVVQIANLIDGLVENDKYGNIVPSIAKSWKHEIIDGESIWTFYLRDNVYWSDYKGNKHSLVTAHDFVSSLKYILNYNSGSSNYSLPGLLIKNAINYYNATLINNFNYDEITNKINNLEISDPNNELNYYTNVKKVFDSCLDSLSCTNDFNDVGIKAINDFELQYTLTQEVPYFLSSLTHYSFLPANEDFIKNIGFNNFGTNKKNLLYNGGYLLNNYFHSSRLEFVKNPNYWDKENVFIEKLIFTKTPGYQTASYARIMYEAGNIDEFNLSKHDSVGYKKYVYGSNNEGTENNPIGNNTYVNNEISNFTTYYILFNQYRVNHKFSTLTNTELEITNKAMQNLNFRKALTYGLNKNNYLNNDLREFLSSVVPPNFIFNNTVDYYSYFIQTYADKNNISYEKSEQLLNNNNLYNLSLSYYYLNLAIEELNLSQDQLPIKIEYTYYTDKEYSFYDKERIKEWNYLLNSCDLSATNCEFDKIEIVYNTSISTVNQYNIALSNKEYNITFLGLYPDFVDPTTYLNSLGANGELMEYLNHSEGAVIDNYLKEINNSLNIDDRLKLCSELDYYIVFEKNLLIPLTTNSSNNQIVISNLLPYQKMKSNYGLSPFKFKFRKISNKKLTQDDIRKLKEEYEEGMLD